MKRIAALLVFYFIVLTCTAQFFPAPDPIDISLIREDSSILNRTRIFIDSTSVLPIHDVLQKDFFSLPEKKRRLSIPESMVTRIYYLKIAVENNSAKETSAWFSPGGYFEKIELYKIVNGRLEDGNATVIPGYRKFTLAAGEHCQLLIRLKPLKNEFDYVGPLLINEKYINPYQIFHVAQRSNLQVFGFIMSGVLFMMILFMITNFIINRKQEFLYNALYSLCMFLLIFFNSIVVGTPSSFTNYYYSYFDFFLLVTGTIFYISFTRKFLDTKINYIKLENFLKYSERFILMLLCIYSILNFLTPTYLPQFFLENIMKFIILAIGIVFIYLAFKQHNRLLNYIAAGNAMLVFFSAVSLALLLLEAKGAGLLSSALFYYYTGITFELTFFLLGLNYKNRYELIQKTREQEAMKLEAEKKEFETQIALIKVQQDERNRISADMHDDLGAGMTTIRLYSEIAKSKLDSNQIPEIDKISSSADELLNKMNAIIWSMSSSNDSLGNMIAYIRSYALEYFENTGIKCKISIPEKLPNIEVIGEIRRNVFLVIKESLNNILKHANATEVNIVLTRVEDGLTLYIQDNGKGIDLEKLRQFGNGLKNMKKRMQDVNIEFNIENNNGTLVTLHRKIVTADFF